MTIVTDQQNVQTQQPQQRRNTGTRLTQSQEVEPIVGYLNIRIKDSQGEYHNIRANIPLFDSNRIHKGIINKVTNDPEAILEIIGTVNLLSDEVPTF